MLPYLIPAGLRLGGSVANYLLRRKRPKFENTAYGQRLMQAGREGRYNPVARRGLLGAVARRTAETAQRQTAGIRGRLVRQGMENSIAGAGLMARPALVRQGLIANATERLETENELSKERARDAFARGRTVSHEQRRQEENAARQGLIQGVTGAAAQGYQGYQLGKLDEAGGGLKTLARATSAGVRLSPYAQRYLLQPEAPAFPDISNMSEQDAAQAIMEWISRTGGAR